MGKSSFSIRALVALFVFLGIGSGLAQPYLYQTFVGTNAPNTGTNFNFSVAAPIATLAITLPNSGPAYSHLLLKKGTPPTDTSYDFISDFNSTSNYINLGGVETTPGTYYLRVRTPSNSPTHAFTLTVQTNHPGIRTQLPVSKPIDFLANGSMSAGTWHYYRIHLTNATPLKFTLDEGDLYIQRGQIPTTSFYLARSINQTEDMIFLDDLQATPGDYFIGVFCPSGTINYNLSSEALNIIPLNFDPGTTDAGTDVYTNSTAITSDFYFKIRTGSPASGAWRTALTVTSGEAHLYMVKGTIPLPSTTPALTKSERAGSDGFVLSSIANHFAAGEDWYILVHAFAGSQWKLVSGEAFIIDLGDVAADSSSSTNIAVGAEGWRFFKTTVPANTLAWRLWLSGGVNTTATNTIYLRKTGAPIVGTSEASQLGQMLVVAPYLAVGQLYYIGVPGNPGSAVNLESRQQPVTDLPFVSSTNVTVAGFGYTTYRVDVPGSAVTWQLNLIPTAGNPNLAVRRNLIPSENYNDAYSEAVAPIADSIALVPPILSGDTFYVTVYAPTNNTNSFTLQSGPATITDFTNHVASATNNETNRVGWRYFRVTYPAGPLGWDLFLTNYSAGTRIALRQSAAPSILQARPNNPSPSYDFISIADFLQRPSHQSGVWYIGVYNPTNALGPFTLITRELPAPVLNGDGGFSTEVNLTSNKWDFFQVTIPPNILGWDLRLTNVLGDGQPRIVVRREGLPTNAVSAGLVTTNLNTTLPSPADPNTTNWATGLQWAPTDDWTLRDFSANGTTNENGRVLAMGMGRPLQPGTYYVGVFNTSPTNNANYTIMSRFIGSGNAIPVTDLAYIGSNSVANLPAREAVYYRMNIASNTPSWKLKLTMTDGEAMLVVSTNKIPNIQSEKRVQKLGKEHFVLLPNQGQNFLVPGDYYVAVISEGKNPTNNTVIGTNGCSFVLQSVGQIDQVNLGTLSQLNPLIITNGFLEGGESRAYRFDSDTTVQGYELTIEDSTGNATMVTRFGTPLADPGIHGSPFDPYGNVGGETTPPEGVSSFRINVSDQSGGPKVIMVKARPLFSGGNHLDANYTLKIKRYQPVPMVYDGGSIVVTNPEPDSMLYFHVDVGSVASRGWDIRIVDVTNCDPVMVVGRDFLPVKFETTSGIDTGNNWPTFGSWAPGTDWTGRSLSSSGDFESGRLLAVGMGRSLQPGNYYIGIEILATNQANCSFRLLSRAIGESNTIPVTNLTFVGGTANGTIAAREAAYYRVDIPTNTPSWQFRLTTAATNQEAMLVVLDDAVPNIKTTPTSLAASLASQGRKLQKLGNEHFLLLPPSNPAGQSNLLAGQYYIAVIGEGRNPIDANHVGTNTTTYTLTSLGQMQIVDLGTITPSGTVQSNSLAGGETIGYKFKVLEGTLSLEARLENRVGNPVMVLREGPLLPDPGASGSGISADSYGSEGGETANNDVGANFINRANPTTNTHYIFIKARQTNSVPNNPYLNASYTLRLNSIGSAPLNFNGGLAVETNHPSGTWRYYIVTVPTNALGWDVRLTNVISGIPKLIIRRDVLPNSTTIVSLGQQNNWPSGSHWVANQDWTKRQFAADGTTDENGRILAMGMGRPLEPGTYYIGITSTSGTNTLKYTLMSRGIGTNMAIPVIDLPYNGGSYTNATLAPREAAYFRIVVPSNAPSWKLKMTGTGGEAMLLGLKDKVPNVDSVTGTTLASGKTMQRPGNEHFVLLPTTVSGLAASTNYFAVIGEGGNPLQNRVGTGNSSVILTSQGELPVNDLGVITSTDLVLTNETLDSGEVKAYKFTVPFGTLGVEVRLEDRSGNPVVVVRRGAQLPDPGMQVGTSGPADAYGYEGGFTTSPAPDGGINLVTIPNPLSGDYTVVVKARPVPPSQFVNASYTLRVREALIPQLNISSLLNTNGLTNGTVGLLEDNQRAFFRIDVPATFNGAPVPGWKLDLTQSSGTPTVRARKGALPEGTTGMPFTNGQAIIVPPFLSPGVWYAEVKGSNSTAFTMTSSVLELERPAWVMPNVGETNVAPGLTFPLFGDSGVTTNGAPGVTDIFLDNGYQHFYGIVVSTQNVGLVRVQLDGISGFPDLYMRYALPPTANHSIDTNGASGNIFDRAMVAGGNEYANWVPQNGKFETQLRPGLYYLMVRANGSANARYRLRVSTGNIQDIDIAGTTLTNQVITRGDWRYYRLQMPTAAPLNWHVTFSQQVGDVVLHLRDTVPPGQTNTTLAQIADWTSDGKNDGTYGSFNDPGTINFSAPPTRFGHTYYLGFWATNNADATFSFTVSTNGGPTAELPSINFYGGSVDTTIPPNGQLTYKIFAPADATRWKHFATHVAAVRLYLEQGTLPYKTGSPKDDWFSNPGTPNSTNNVAMTNWPWMPNQTYYLTVTNTTALSQPFAFNMDGQNAATDDNDNDGMLDAWEVLYFGNTSQLPNNDPDGDTVSNINEFLEGTNPNNGNSYRPRLITPPASFGIIVRDIPSTNNAYDMNTTVTLTAVPTNAAYAFAGWSNNASGLVNPLPVLMNTNKTISAIFKVIGDDFVMRVPLSGGLVATTGTTVSATRETGEPNHGGSGQRSIWWTWTAPASASTTIDTAGSAFNTLLGVYTGSNVSNLTTIATSSTVGTIKAKVTFNAVAGTTYQIAVDGIAGASGTANLSIVVNDFSQLISPATVGNGFRFTLQGQPVRIYQVQASTNLVNWIPITNVTTSAGGTVQVTNTSTFPYRFYRAISQ